MCLVFSVKKMCYRLSCPRNASLRMVFVPITTRENLMTSQNLPGLHLNKTLQARASMPLAIRLVSSDDGSHRVRYHRFTRASTSPMMINQPTSITVFPMISIGTDSKQQSKHLWSLLAIPRRHPSRRTLIRRRRRNPASRSRKNRYRTKRYLAMCTTINYDRVSWHRTVQRKHLCATANRPLCVTMAFAWIECSSPSAYLIALAVCF